MPIPKYITSLLIVTAAAIPVNYMMKTSEAERQERMNEMTVMINKAISYSAGNDKIWSMAEKRDFLDKMGISLDGVLQESDRIDIIPVLGVHDEKEKYLVLRDRSFTPLGELSVEKVREYIDSNSR